MDFTVETVLVRALQSGDNQAYQHLVDNHTSRLQSVAKNILGNAEDARDAVQDALISVFKGIKNFSGKCKLDTWLYRIVVNAALMKLRVSHRKPAHQLDDEVAGKLHDSGKATPLAVVNRQETGGIVRRTIWLLPQQHRRVLLLRDIEGLSTKQTANRLNLTPGVVKVRLHRARKALGKVLEPSLIED